MLDSAAGSKPHCAVPVKNVDAIEMLLLFCVSVCHWNYLLHF